MRGHDLPTNIREAHPGLHLAAGHFLTAHLTDKGDRGDVAADRDNIQPQTCLLAARPWGAGHPVRVNTIKDATVLVIRQSDSVRAVPEGDIQHLDIFVYQRLLVALEKVTDFLHNLGDIGGMIVAHACSSSARATATSVAALPRGPMIEKPSVHSGLAQFVFKK